MPDTDLNYYGTYAAFRSYLRQDPKFINKAPFRGMMAADEANDAGGEASWAFGDDESESETAGEPISDFVTSPNGFPMIAMPPMMPPMMAPLRSGMLNGPMGRGGRNLLQKRTTASSGLMLTLPLVSSWAKALELGTVIRFYDAERYQTPFSSWDLLADTLGAGAGLGRPRFQLCPQFGTGCSCGSEPPRLC